MEILQAIGLAIIAGFCVQLILTKKINANKEAKVTWMILIGIAVFLIAL